MLYSKNSKTIQTRKECMTCEYFDKKKKHCNGIGKNCFEYDVKTQTAIDPVTKLPIRL